MAAYYWHGNFARLHYGRNDIEHCTVHRQIQQDSGMDFTKRKPIAGVKNSSRQQKRWQSNNKRRHPVSGRKTDSRTDDPPLPKKVTSWCVPVRGIARIYPFVFPLSLGEINPPAGNAAFHCKPEMKERMREIRTGMPDHGCCCTIPWRHSAIVAVCPSVFHRRFRSRARNSTNK